MLEFRSQAEPRCVVPCEVDALGNGATCAIDGSMCPKHVPDRQVVLMMALSGGGQAWKA